MESEACRSSIEGGFSHQGASLFIWFFFFDNSSSRLSVHTWVRFNPSLLFVLDGRVNGTVQFFLTTVVSSYCLRPSVVSASGSGSSPQVSTFSFSYSSAESLCKLWQWLRRKLSLCAVVSPGHGVNQERKTETSGGQVCVCACVCVLSRLSVQHHTVSELKLFFLITVCGTNPSVPSFLFSFPCFASPPSLFGAPQRRWASLLIH